MKMGIKIRHAEWGRVEAGIRNIAKDVPANAARTMRRASARIVKRAQLYVPEDNMLLHDSIRAVERRGGVVGGRSGRLSIDIVAGGEGTVDLPFGGHIDVDQYAIIIHERYSEYKPGKGTLRKMEMNPGVHIGEKFIERAVNEDQRLLEFEVAEAVTRVIRDSGMTTKGVTTRARLSVK